MEFFIFNYFLYLCTIKINRIDMKTLEESLPGTSKILDELFKETMKPDTLNLPLLLKGHEKEEFYSPTFGKLIYQYTDDNCMKFACVDNANEILGFLDDGRFYSCGEPAIWPSRDLYEQYPDNACLAWEAWQAFQLQKYILEIDMSSWFDGEAGREKEEYSGKKWFVFNTYDEMNQAKKAIRELLINYIAI